MNFDLSNSLAGHPDGHLPHITSWYKNQDSRLLSTRGVDLWHPPPFVYPKTRFFPNEDKSLVVLRFRIRHTMNSNTLLETRFRASNLPGSLALVLHLPVLNHLRSCLAAFVAFLLRPAGYL